MEKLFLTVLNMSLTASLLVLVVLLVRTLFKKAPRWISCILWAMVALRLICPFTPESRFSLMPSAEPVPSGIAVMEHPEVTTGIVVLNNTVNPILTDSFTPDPINSVNPLQIVIAVAALVWILGMAGFAIYGVISYVLLYRKVRESVAYAGKAKLCDGIQTPFILGVIRPVIYLPSGLSEEQLSHVMAHENAHLKRLDHIWKPVGFVVLAIHWFNPFVWVFYVLLCKDIEIACDEKVLRNFEKTEKTAYAQTLLDCSLERRNILMCPVAFGEISVKERIKHVLSFKKPTVWIIMVSVIVCGVVAVCFLTDPKSDEEEIVQQVLEPVNDADAVAEGSENEGTVQQVVYKGTEAVKEPGVSLLANNSVVQVHWSDGTVTNGVNFPFVTCKVEPRGYWFNGITLHLAYDVVGEDITEEMVSVRAMEAEEETAYFLSNASEDRIVMRAVIQLPQMQDSVDLFIGCEGDETEYTFTLSKTETSAMDLNQAVHMAILQKGALSAPGSEEGMYQAASFVELGRAMTDGTVEEVYVYGMAMYMEGDVTEKGIHEKSGWVVPAALMFQKIDGIYILKEYWEPEDGGRYQESIREKFPDDIAEQVMDSQMLVYLQNMDCYDQFIRLSGMDPEPVIGAILKDICSPNLSSASETYIKNSPIEFRELLYYGQYTIDYRNKYYEGAQNLESEVINEACRQIEELSK